MRTLVIVMVLARIAAADPTRVAWSSGPPPAADATTAEQLPTMPVEAVERPQLQLDLGLGVIGVAYEHPAGEHLAIGGAAHIYGTYFAPWFSAGQSISGFGLGTRVTWFRDRGNRGLYVAPFLRVGHESGDFRGASGDGTGYSMGVFAGWAWVLPVPGLHGKHFDLRIGAGLQYMHYLISTTAGPAGMSTPFLALDAIVGYRI